MKRYGFTIVEVIIVVVMLGILAAIAIPKIIGPSNRIMSSEGQHTLTVLLSAQKRYYLENNSVYTGTYADLDVDIPTSKYFNTPNAVNGTGGIVATVSSKTANTNLTYTLSINTSGSITCDDGVGTDCAVVGCTKGGGGNQCNL